MPLRLAVFAAASTLALAACSPKPVASPQAQPAAAEPAKPAVADLPAGDYALDKAHSALMFKVSHLGFSNYPGRFEDFDAKLTLDPANPAAAAIEVTINPQSLQIPAPPPGFLDTLKGKEWLDTSTYPVITFRSTKVDVTGSDTARITGDLTLHGVTKPVVLEARFNGGYAGHPMDPNARIGFSATGSFNRSDFGLAYGVPAPGTTMGVGDKVSLDIETEFTGPPLAATSPPAKAG